MHVSSFIYFFNQNCKVISVLIKIVLFYFTNPLNPDILNNSKSSTVVHLYIYIKKISTIIVF